MTAALAALLGAAIGGALSVLASWLAQRVQSKSQLLSQEIQRRQQLYSAFVQRSARCYADALRRNDVDRGTLANLYGEIGRMRLYSSTPVVAEATKIAHRILDAYSDRNRDDDQIRQDLVSDSIDLFSAFSSACRAEIAALRLPGVVVLAGPASAWS